MWLKKREIELCEFCDSKNRVKIPGLMTLESSPPFAHFEIFSAKHLFAL
jgi:hypothetical protein